MTCQGVGTRPHRVYRAHSYRTLVGSGRKVGVAGRGRCSVCGGVYVTKVQRGSNLVEMGRHKDLRQASDATKQRHERLRKRWERYVQQGSLRNLQGNDASLWWGGPVTQNIGVIENPGAELRSGSRFGFQSWASATPFRMEITSSTYHPLTDQYVFAFNDNYFTYPTRTVTVMTSAAVWAQWNSSITISANSTVTSQAWQSWTHSGNVITEGTPGRFQAYLPPRPDPVAIEHERQRRAEELFHRVETENRAKAEAQQQAERTLLSLLTPEQREEYRARRYFHIRGSRGTLYRILHGSAGNIREVTSDADSNRGLHAYCAHPRMVVTDDNGQRLGVLPHEDAMIAQMLALTSDEEGFLAIANRHW